MSMLLNSTSRVLLLSGGIIKYVSSAYLQSRLPAATACKLLPVAAPTPTFSLIFYPNNFQWFMSPLGGRNMFY